MSVRPREATRHPRSPSACGAQVLRGAGRVGKEAIRCPLDRVWRAKDMRDEDVMTLGEAEVTRANMIEYLRARGGGDGGYCTKERAELRGLSRKDKHAVYKVMKDVAARRVREKKHAAEKVDVAAYVWGKGPSYYPSAKVITFAGVRVSRQCPRTPQLIMQDACVEACARS